MNNTDPEHNYDTQDLARKLETCPTPQLAIRNISERWHCSRSTVVRFRRAHGLRSDGPADSHPVFDLLDLLALEEDIPDPLVAWTLGTDEDRTILSAPLLSVEDLKLLDRTLDGHHPETFRRHARTGKRPGFQIGRRWLFRPTMEDIARLRELRNTSPVAQ